MKRSEFVLCFLMLCMLVGCSALEKSERIRIYSYSSEHDRKVLLTKSDLIKQHEMSFAKKTLKQMLDFLKKREGGIGIAAPQIGISKRLIVIDLTSVPGLENSKPILMINPVIKEKRGESLSFEGCLSVDGFGVFKRSSEISVTFLSPDGSMHYSNLIGIEAFCCQHEIDHLDGKLISDKDSITGLKDHALLAKELKDMNTKIKNDLRLDELKSKYSCKRAL